MLLLALEFGLSVLAILLAFIAPRLGDSWFSSIESRLSQFASRRRLAILTILVLALGSRLAVLPIEPIPHPGIHDEFSHLLIADTLLHGRLANPTPKMWVHFETFHENFTPAYASMYYPGQGIVLALGKLLFGHPFWGVWLSTGLMCAAFCWALQGWLPPGWAFLGGILAIIRLGTFSYWANSYWGGSLTALGGALVVGALPRLLETQRIREALAMGFGFAILANTRPYESLFFCVPAALGLFLFLWFKNQPRLPWLRTVVLPTTAVVSLTAVFMAFYFYRTTGSAFTIPYQINMRRYGYVYFPWQHWNHQITFNHEAMKKFYVDQLEVTFERYRNRTLITFLTRLLDMFLFYLNFTLIPPLLCLMIALPVNIHVSDIPWRLRVLTIAFACSIVGIALACYLSPHYAAPMTCALYVLYLLACRRVYLWSPWSRSVGKALVRSVPVTCFVLASVYILFPGARPKPSFSIQTWFTRWETLDRTSVERVIRSEGGSNVIFVRYQTEHKPNDEWVFNEADIGHSQIIWARDMGAEKNKELLNYYRDRKAWLLQPEYSPPHLTPYMRSRQSEATSVASR